MSEKTYFHRVQEQTKTRFWINNVTREEAKLAIEAGACGCTQNPSYTWKIMSDPNEQAHVRELLRPILAAESDDNEALVCLQRELIGEIAEIFQPMYESTQGQAGYVSIQGDPFHEDTETIVRHARFNREAGPNIMAKIPVTVEGLEAIEILAKERVPINATEVMAIRQAMDVCEVYSSAVKGMENPAPALYSHIAGIYDEYLQNYVKEHAVAISRDALWQAGISVAKKCYHMTRERSYPVGFIGGGARGLHHYTEMVGAAANITINWKGTADRLIEQDPVVIQQFLRPTPDSVVDELLEKLEDYRKAYLLNAIDPHEYEHFGPVVLFRTSFEKAWKNALGYVAEYRAELAQEAVGAVAAQVR